ncbi:hypothetical protein BN2476_40008 [Paraburkholderia piptadeniae]|uniref:Uncharacterized protein n=1 Tax=Paraburkholderia piptadeniae TaxID=1701573 RepID=A0A1N7RJZ3_9BURK|nr:hypothetical protein BN2476_40008 [Paraburkholderia piptadeniae]
MRAIMPSGISSTDSTSHSAHSHFTALSTGSSGMIRMPTYTCSRMPMAMIRTRNDRRRIGGSRALAQRGIRVAGSTPTDQERQTEGGQSFYKQFCALAEGSPPCRGAGAVHALRCSTMDATSSSSCLLNGY